jgi:hypothetical protein
MNERRRPYGPVIWPPLKMIEYLNFGVIEERLKGYSKHS